MKLGIDIGSFNTKTSEGAIFKSAITESIEYGNQYDQIEIGDEIPDYWKKRGN